MDQYQVSFGDAIKRAFSQYCCFTGRASRSEYWWFALFNFIVSAVLEAVLGTSSNFAVSIIGLWSLVTLLPSLGLVFRRLHDTNRSGWNILWALLPLIGTIILIVFFCKPSDPEANNYGPMPNPII